MAQINIGGLTKNAITAKGLSDLILVTPKNPIGYQPQIDPKLQGPGLQQKQAFFFNYEGDQSLSLASDVTDHYVEDNTAIADQVALKPEEVTVNGFVGELNDVAPRLLEPLKLAAEKLTVVSAYVPQVSITALLAYNNAKLAYDTAQNIITNSVQAWQSFSSGGSVKAKTKQELAYMFFYGYWRDRTLFTVQTPWQVMDNMVIKNLKALQNSETNQFSDFEITFKKMRFAKSITRKLSDVLGVNLSTRADYQRQASQPVNLGNATPEPGGGNFRDRLPTRVGGNS